MEDTSKKASFVSQIRGLPSNFWYACFMEILERLAFYGSRAVAPLYLVASSGQNGLGLTYTEKGAIYSVWALIQCLLPMVTGGYTDRYGYRKSLAVAFIINILGYACMAESKPIADFLAGHGWEHAGFWVFMFAASLVGTGTAIFKPPAHGTIAKSTTEETSSMGWGVFYWVVNIGGGLAPMLAAKLRGDTDWDIVFWGAAFVTACIFLPAFLLYKEPEKVAPADGEAQPKGVVGVFVHSVVTIFKDWRLVVFMGIFACFWLMFMQLWDLLPNFINEWVDSSDVAPVFGWFSEGWVAGNGQVKPEMIVNIDSIAIIALVIPISWLVGKISKIAAMIIGMLISLVGFVGTGATNIGWFCCLMVFVFAIGEMACSPTFSAYIGLIAPKDKKALYMGYSNIPYAIGWAAGGAIAGFLYDGYGAQAQLALQELGTETAMVARAAKAADWSDSLEKIPPLLKIERGEAFEMAQAELGVDRDAAVKILRDDFKYDRGQVENLALQYIALHPDNRKKTLVGFAKRIEGLCEELDGLAKQYTVQVDKLPTTPANSGDDVGRVEKDHLIANQILEQTEQVKEDVTRLKGLTSSDTALNESSLAEVVHLLPEVTSKQRGSALSAVRELVNKDLPREQWKHESEIAGMLWEQFGDDPEVLNNLALEYLAQSTNLIHDAIADLPFEHPVTELDKRIAEITSLTGIDRTKSFNALSAAMGGDDAKVDAALRELNLDTFRTPDRLYVCLASDRRHRFKTVSERDWRNDLTLLREIVRSDDEVLKVVLDGIDEESWLDRLIGWVRGILTSGDDTGEMTEEGVNYKRLARKGDLIQKALDAKDWARSPDHSAQLMQLNPFEARSLIGADVTLAKRTLWDRYHPYQVWYYLGGIGLLGTIGMIIFYLVTKKPTTTSAEETVSA